MQQLCTEAKHYEKDGVTVMFKINAQIVKHELTGTLRAVGSGARDIYFGIGEDGLLYIYVNGKKTGEGIDTGIRIRKVEDEHGGINWYIEAPQIDGNTGTIDTESITQNLVKAVNKVVMNNEALLDVTTDTVTAAGLLFGQTATGADGKKITGIIVDGDAVGFGNRADPRVNLGQADYLIVLDGEGIEPVVNIGLCDVAVLTQ